MKALCRYFTNNLRLSACISTFAEGQNFRFFCVRGAVVKDRNEFKVLTEEVTVIVSSVSKESHKNLVAVLTSEARYKNLSGSFVDYSALEHDNIGYALCKLLRSKFEVAGNLFTIEFSREGETLIVSAIREGNAPATLNCIVRGVAGEVRICGDEAVGQALHDCGHPRAFSFQTLTPEVEKSISVRKSLVEIYKEIAHYCHKTLVLVGVDGRDILTEQYFSSKGIVEVVTNSSGGKYYKKLSGVTFNVVDAFCVYLTSATPTDIIQEQERIARTRPDKYKNSLRGVDLVAEN